jgi:hypothetical protein
VHVEGRNGMDCTHVQKLKKAKREELEIEESAPVLRALERPTKRIRYTEHSDDEDAFDSGEEVEILEGIALLRHIAELLQVYSDTCVSM